jgi:hypothetical protein
MISEPGGGQVDIRARRHEGAGDTERRQAVTAEETYGIVLVNRGKPRRHPDLSVGDYALQVAALASGFTSFWGVWTLVHMMHWFGT